MMNKKVTTPKQVFDKAYFNSDECPYNETTSFFEIVNWDEVALDSARIYNRITGLKLKSFLDVGCASGFLVKALRDIRVAAFGIDISKWAIDNSTDDVKAFLKCVPATKFKFKEHTTDMISAYGCLHYLTEKEVEKIIKSLDCKVLHIGQFPLNDKPETIKAWKAVDTYTQLFKPMEWWVKLLTDNGYSVDILDYYKDEHINIYASKKNRKIK